MLDLVKRKGTASEVNIKRYGIGDQYAEALSNGLSKYRKLKGINVSDNRLTDRGGARLLKAINYQKLINLDLSYNTLGKNGI